MRRCFCRLMANHGEHLRSGELQSNWMFQSPGRCGVHRGVDRFDLALQGGPIAFRGQPERVTDQVNDAGLHDRLRPHVRHHLREAFQPVADHEEHVLDPTVAQIGEHAHPELGALTTGAGPQAEDVLISVEGDSGSSSGTVTVILAVVGGVLVLGLMAGVVFLVIRGRRREREFMYFEPYASPQLAQITAGPTSSAPASGPLAIAPVSTVPTSAVPASPYAPPVSSPPVSAPQFSGPPVSAPPISGPPGGYYYPPPTATYPVVPVPPPTPMAVSPQYGQALPEPVWATPAAPVPVPEPPTDPAASSATAPTAPAAGTPEQYAAQPWEPPDEDRTIGSPPDAYRHRP